MIMAEPFECLNSNSIGTAELKCVNIASVPPTMDTSERAALARPAASPLRARRPSTDNPSSTRYTILVLGGNSPAGECS